MRTRPPEYDALGRVTRITYPDSGEVVTYAYDATALKSVNSNLPITADGKTSHAYFSDYNALCQAAGEGRLRKRCLDGHTYDPTTQRLDTLKTTAPALSNPSLQDMKYLYDKVGNVTSLTDLRYPGTRYL